MPVRTVRVALVLALAACLAAPAFAADGSIEGVWLGVSSNIGSVFRLELRGDRSGTVQYVSRVGEQPAVRSYDVRSWELDGVDIELDLEPLDDAPRLRLRGKLRSGQLDLEIVRRKGDKPERLRMSPEARFLEDLERIRGASRGG